MGTWMNGMRRAWPLLLAIGMAWQVPAQAEYKSANPVVVTLTTPPAFREMSLSPDGKHIAAIGYSERATGLFLLDATTLEARLLIQPRRTFGGFLQPYRVLWIGNDLLVATLNDGTSVSLDLNGREVATIQDSVRMRLAADVPGAPETVLTTIDTHSGRVRTANPRTGERASESIGLPDDIVRTRFDAAGVLRWVVTRKTAYLQDDTRLSHWYRTDAKAEWQLLDTIPVTGDGMDLLAVEPDGRLIIASRRGRDTYGIFHYDPKTRQQLELMAGVDTQDLTADIDDNAMVLGVVTRGLKPVPVWFEPKWARLQKTVDASLPDRVNRLSGRVDGRVLVFSYGDTDPGRWFILDTADLKLWEVGAVNPAIDPARMRPMETLRYPASDGLDIPAYLTRPALAAGAAPPPLVVLIHGGPAIRDHWAWDEEAQVYAAHGYAVFQPQFRGSSGFGRKFEDAGIGQWGFAMQDDITAGVQHLIDRKLVDPKRVCIVGASYGGYAALWGLAKTPQLYRCGISIAGVVDIAYMLDDNSAAANSRIGRQFMRQRVGDAEKDKTRFDEVSPLKNAARIQAPVLLVHGTDDVVVPIAHGQKMRDALKEQGKAVEWKPLHGVGHAFYLEDRQRMYDAVLDFLARNLAAPATK